MASLPPQPPEPQPAHQLRPNPNASLKPNAASSLNPSWGTPRQQLPNPTSNTPFPGRPPAPKQAPPPLKPTEMPYAMLRKDPRFRSLSRKWTGIIVGLPIVFATSYELWGRNSGMREQKKVVVRDEQSEKIQDGEAEGVKEVVSLQKDCNNLQKQPD